jgi:ferredoxin
MPTRELWVRVDARLREGHGLCLQLAPEVFDMTDDDIAVCAKYLGGEHAGSIRAAVAACPRQAITVLDETGDPAKMRS